MFLVTSTFRHYLDTLCSLYWLIAENLDTNSESRAVFSYLQYSRNTSNLMPLSMDESVSRRWGVNITIGSPIIQVALFVPEYVWMKESSDGEDNSLENNMEDIEGKKNTVIAKKKQLV